MGCAHSACSKQDGSVRICGDFKVTINQVSQVESYPLPRVEELFATLSGGKQLSKLDSAQAYLQITFSRRFKRVCNYQYIKGVVSIQQVSIRSVFSCSHFSEMHRKSHRDVRVCPYMWMIFWYRVSPLKSICII